MGQLFKKIFSLSTLVLVTALILSGIAAWYSILGLTAIFAAAAIPVIIMGISLELGKVVTTVWLHRYWDKATWVMKAYLLPAVLVLALITSMGIFGFLSKAHIEQGVSTSQANSELAIIDERIKTYRENIASQRVNIDTARNAVKLLDEQVTARIGMGFDDGSSAERAVQIRRQQRTERESLAREINEAQTEIQRLNTEISRLNEERIPLAANLQEVEAKVGPIKYIAALIYGDEPDQNTLERAVRWVIILLVIVFDPLALVLIMAALTSYRWEFGKKEEYKPIPPIAVYSQWPSFAEGIKKENVEGTSIPDVEQEIQPPIETPASDIEITADSNTITHSPVKKKLSLSGLIGSLKEKLGNLRLKISTSKLSSSPSWEKLKRLSKSLLWNLLKISLSKQKRLKRK